MSPKSLLRHKMAVSPLRDFSEGAFRTVLPEPAALAHAAVRRVLLCSGKVYYDLLVAREQRDADDVAIVRVEQLYPFPADDIVAAVAAYTAADEVFWVQEEPWNMGAWYFIRERLQPLVGERPLRYVGRDEAASPATGSYKIHQAEQADIIDRALRKRHGR
jgi:2-oxoglutarate dehydrogenase E1 component